VTEEGYSSFQISQVQVAITKPVGAGFSHPRMYCIRSASQRDATRLRSIAQLTSRRRRSRTAMVIRLVVEQPGVQYLLLLEEQMLSPLEFPSTIGIESARNSGFILGYTRQRYKAIATRYE
jgi:hypothetical protein